MGRNYLSFITFTLFLLSGCTSSPSLRESNDSLNGVKLFATQRNTFSAGAPDSQEPNSIINLDLVKVVGESERTMFYFDLVVQAGEPIQILDKDSLVIKCNDSILHFSPSAMPGVSRNRFPSEERAKFVVADVSFLRKLATCGVVQVRVLGRLRLLQGHFKKANLAIVNDFVHKYVPAE